MSSGLFLVLMLCSLDQVLSCTTGAGVSCPEDVANTFLAIHQSVAKESQTGASSTKITGQLDLVIIIDEGALKPAQHYWVKQLIKILSEIFVISPQYTRVAVVAYSASPARVIIPMSSNADVCSFMPSITNISFAQGSSYLVSGIDAAIKEFNAGRKSASKLTILLSNGDWGNLGSKPEASVARLKALSRLAAVILKHPNQNVGLIRSVLFDEFVSFFGSKKLGFTAEMTPEYLRDLHNITQYNKAMSPDWPLDITVAQAKCKAMGRTCIGTDKCICETRTILNEYICVGKDVDPPEAVTCTGPPSPITAQSLVTSSAQVTWAQPLFSDTSGIVSVTSDMLPGLYHPGTYRVVSKATDDSQNTATCSFSFTVQQ